MPALPTTSYALLGLLSIGSMSGYDLALAADRSIANFWPISRSQIYGELTRLEGLGYLEGSDVAQERLPDKRVFAITDEGRHAFETWLATPGYDAQRIRLGFLVKVFFGHGMPKETMVVNLEQFKREAQGRVDYLRRIVEMLDPIPEAVYVQATARLGLRIAESSIAWADETLAVVESRHSVADSHEGSHEAARELMRNAPPRPKNQQSRSQ